MNTAELLGKLKNLINSKDFLLRHRINKKVFVRKRILTFHVTIAIILNAVRDSTSAELDKFSDYFDTTEPTKSAFSQARHKIKHTAFIELNDTLIKEYYKSPVKIMSCRRCFFSNMSVLALDGYDLQLPVSNPIKEHFGCATNASDKQMPMALASELYDVESGLTISSFIDPYTAGERNIAIKLIEDFIKKGLNTNEFVFTFDRGYPSLFLLTYLIFLKINFVMRCKKQFLSEINEAVASERKDQIIEIPLKKLKKDEKEVLKSRFPWIDFSGVITIRVCLVELDTGEVEILLTSLISKKKFPHKIFKKLYSKRWGVETDIRFQKTRLEIENFSGESVLAVKQEFFASILWKNTTNMLIMEAESEMFEIKEESESELIGDCENSETFIDGVCELIKAEEMGEIDFYNKSESFVGVEYNPIKKEEIIQIGPYNSSIPSIFQNDTKNNSKCPIDEASLNQSSESAFKQPLVNHHEIQSQNAVTRIIKKTRGSTDFEKAVNRSIAYSRMKNRFIKALFDPNIDMDNFCNTMKNLMKKNLEPIRPRRKFKRKKQYPGKKFHKNARRTA